MTEYLFGLAIWRTRMTLRSNFSGLGADSKQGNQNTQDKTHFEDKENRRRKWAQHSVRRLFMTLHRQMLMNKSNYKSN